jgi:prevent-host-death family protein
MKTVSAAEANRHFSALLRDVAQGERVLITSRGKPVARLVPVAAEVDPAREAARERLLAHLSQVTPSGEPRDWTREDLYD